MLYFFFAGSFFLFPFHRSAHTFPALIPRLATAPAPPRVFATRAAAPPQRLHLRHSFTSRASVTAAVFLGVNTGARHPRAACFLSTSTHVPFPLYSRTILFFTLSCILFSLFITNSPTRQNHKPHLLLAVCHAHVPLPLHIFPLRRSAKDLSRNAQSSALTKISSHP